MKAARVIPPRILPVVIAAATGLLTLKTLGLVTQGGYVLQPGEGSGFARGLSQPRRDPAWASGDDITGASSAPKAPAAPKQEEPGRKADPNQPLPTPLPTAAEREVLENLGSRRKALDERSKELDLREQLLKSAEKLTQDRLDELKQAEARIEREAAKPSPELKALIVLYETMKPKDAARVFDKMEPGKVLPLARQIAPKKLAEIVAAMTPESAQRLTSLMIPAAPSAAAPRADGPQVEELERLPLPPGEASSGLRKTNITNQR